MTKQQSSIYRRYLESELFTLWDCYEKFSLSKHLAYKQCRQRCNDMNGKNFQIISYNTSMFTCGWQFKKANGEFWFHYESNRTTREWRI